MSRDPRSHAKTPSAFPPETPPEGAPPFGRRWLTPSEIPTLLQQIPSPPRQLSAWGNVADARPAIAVVGSRRASALGQQAAFTLGRELAEWNIVVVSGLARGIDAAALRGAISVGGRAAAVLGSGLQQIYPPENQALATSIVECGGFILSEFPFHATPRRHYFPQRNRLISGLSLGVVVVEAALRSGSLITARLALEQGRDVCAYPGPVDTPNHQGCHALIQDGAALVTCGADVVTTFGADNAR